MTPIPQKPEDDNWTPFWVYWLIFCIISACLGYGAIIYLSWAIPDIIQLRRGA